MYHGRGGAGGVWSVGRPVNHHPPELSLVSQSRRAASQMLPKPAFVVDGGDTKNCFPLIIFDNSRKYTYWYYNYCSSGYRHDKLDGYRAVLTDRPLCNMLMMRIIFKNIVVLDNLFYKGGQPFWIKASKDLKSITLFLANVRR